MSVRSVSARLREVRLGVTSLSSDSAASPTGQESKLSSSSAGRLVNCDRWESFTPE
mgnify:CR=1 FL=1